MNHQHKDIVKGKEYWVCDESLLKVSTYSFDNDEEPLDMWDWAFFDTEGEAKEHLFELSTQMK